MSAPSNKRQTNKVGRGVSLKIIASETVNRGKKLLTSQRLSANNPRFSSSLKRSQFKSVQDKSAGSVTMSFPASTFDMTPDQQVGLALSALKKGNEAQKKKKDEEKNGKDKGKNDARKSKKGEDQQRKIGEMLNGPSVAMNTHHENRNQAKTNNTRLFRRWLPSANLNFMSQTRNTRVAVTLPKAEIEFIKQSLKRLILFNKLSVSLLDQIAESMTARTYGPDQIICKQGEFGQELFIVKQGEVLVSKEFTEAAATKDRKVSVDAKSDIDSHYIEDRRVSSKRSSSVISHNSLVESHTLKSGDVFGELGMHYGSPRERTVSTLTPATLYVLHRSAYSKIVENEFLRRNELMFEALSKVKILEQMHPEQLRNLLQFVELITFPKGSKIIEKGSLAGTFYMIVNGTVECVVFEKEKGAVESEFNRLLQNNKQKTEFFEESSTDNLSGIDKEFDRDDESLGTIVKRDSVGRKLVRRIHEYGRGDYFGERGLLQNDFVRKADVIAKTDVELLALTYETFSEHLSGLKDYFEENIRMQALEEAPFFDHLTKEESKLLEETLGVVEFADGEYILKEGVANDKFYIIRNGEVNVKRMIDTKIENSFEIAVLKEKSYFGEGSILSDKPPNASIIANGQVHCYVLSKESFMKFISPEKVKIIADTFHQRNHVAIKRTRERKNILLAQVQLPELKVLKNLGSGCFGLVKLVEVPNMESCFALKMLEKGTVVQNNQEINVMNEKNILLSSDHPFIVKLYRTFKDKFYLYFLMEFLQGGELFQYLHNNCNGYFENSTAKFFVACVVDALEYLHKKQIVYRDLKPENVMIDETGYGRVVDFGFAKKLVFRTFTLCGTAQYLAPEILQNGGYTRSVDFWTLGIFIYELFTGTTPFKRSKRDELFHAIKYENKIRFHSRRWKGGEEAKNLVCLLLHKHPRKRLGCIGSRARGFKDVKENEWFKDLDFEKLFFKEINPPWIPTIKSPKDASCFEPYDEEESPLLGKYDAKSGNSELWKDF